MRIYPRSFLSLLVLGFTIVVAPPALSLDTLSLPNGTVGTAYNATLAASGGTPAYNWAVTAGTLPAGLTPSYL